MTEEELREKLYIIANEWPQHLIETAAILSAFAELRQERDAACDIISELFIDLADQAGDLIKAQKERDVALEGERRLRDEILALPKQSVNWHKGWR